MSKYWIFNFWKDEQYIQHYIVGFPEWANNIYFYTDLVESNDKSWKIFNAYKKLMDMEFPDLEILKTAEIGDANWLICPLCIDAFESNIQDGLVECPKCNNIFNNPRYKNELPNYKR